MWNVIDSVVQGVCDVSYRIGRTVVCDPDIGELGVTVEISEHVYDQIITEQLGAIAWARLATRISPHDCVLDCEAYEDMGPLAVPLVDWRGAGLPAGMDRASSTEDAFNSMTKSLLSISYSDDSQEHLVNDYRLRLLSQGVSMWEHLENFHFDNRRSSEALGLGFQCIECSGDAPPVEWYENMFRVYGERVFGDIVSSFTNIYGPDRTAKVVRKNLAAWSGEYGYELADAVCIRQLAKRMVNALDSEALLQDYLASCPESKRSAVQGRLDK